MNVDRKRTILCQKGYCKIRERKIKPCFEFESISVLLLRESGGGTCQRVEEEEEIQQAGNNAQARTAMELLGMQTWMSKTAPIVKMAALLPPSRLPSLYRLARLPRGENRSQLTSLARNGYIQSHTVSSTLTPNIFKLLLHTLFFLFFLMRRLPFWLFGSFVNSWCIQPSEILVILSRRRCRHCRRFSMKRHARKCIAMRLPTFTQRSAVWHTEVEKRMTRRGTVVRARYVKDTCKRGTLKFPIHLIRTIKIMHLFLRLRFKFLATLLTITLKCINTLTWKINEEWKD